MQNTPGGVRSASSFFLRFVPALAGTLLFIAVLHGAAGVIFRPATPPPAAVPVAAVPAAAPAPVAAPAPAAPPAPAAAPAPAAVAPAAEAPARPAPAAAPATVAAGDSAAGKALSARCATCHSLAEGGPNRVGPALFGIVGRPVASHESFAYSAAMRRKAGGGQARWDEAALDAFLAEPKKAVPGTAMSFPGLPDARQRADLIAWLKSLQPAAPAN